MGKKRKLLAAATLATAFVAGVHIVNKLAFFYATMKERLKKGTSDTFYDWRFGKIYYTKEGSGKPLLLLHRLNYAASGDEWAAIRGKLAENHTVYTLDLLGCGRSEKPKVTYTNYLYVQMVNDFIKEVIKSRTDVMTSGNASVIASMSCLVEPSLYRRLIFIQPEKISATGKTPKANHKALKYLVEMPILGTCIYNIVSSKCALSRQYKDILFEGDLDSRQEFIECMREAAHLGGPSARYVYASVRSHFADIYIGNAIKQLNHSIFIIGSDSEESREAVQEYIAYNPAIESEIIEGTRLLIQQEKPEQVLELCRMFLA